MEVLTRKQREIQQRERQILALARPILVREGYQSLSMERLAAEMEYAKGTLYNHFPNKEEIVAALALESLQLRRTLFEVASVISSSSRERMIAIGVCCDLYATEYATHFAVEQMLRNAVIWEKSSEIRRDLIRQCEYRAMGIVAGVVRDGVANRDLIVPHTMTAEEFAFGFWSLLYGSRAIIDSSPSLPDLGVNNPEICIHIHGCTLMNGFQWQPLMTYEATEELMQSFSGTIVARIAAMNTTT